MSNLVSVRALVAVKKQIRTMKNPNRSSSGLRLGPLDVVDQIRLCFIDDFIFN